MPEKFNGLGGVRPLVPLPQLVAIQMKSFLDAPSAKHRPEARSLALYLLDTAADGRIDPVIFEQVLSSAGVDDSDLNQIIQVDRHLAQVYYDSRMRVDAINKQMQERPAPQQSTASPTEVGHSAPDKSALLAERTAQEGLKSGADAEIKAISSGVLEERRRKIGLD
ncbi:MAG: hypothetical protein M3Y72_21485 [Acidobacteriota bacterium]|nr:hypothetical protein [Acidobacteriota bacterium]